MVSGLHAQTTASPARRRLVGAAASTVNGRNTRPAKGTEASGTVRVHVQTAQAIGDALPSCRSRCVVRPRGAERYRSSGASSERRVSSKLQTCRSSSCGVHGFITKRAPVSSAPPLIARIG